MKTAKRAPKGSSFQMIAQLSEQDRKRIAQMLRRDLRPLKLTAAQESELYLVLEHYFQDIEAWQAELQRIKPRSKRAMRLRRIEKALRRVQYEVESSGEILNEILPFDLSERLGGKMTFAALRAAAGPSKWASNLRLSPKVLIKCRNLDDIESLEAVFDYKRRALGLEHAGRVFKSMIDDLYAPLGQWVERDKKVAGRKPMQLRNMLIERLVEASPRILGRRATSTEKGRFEQLCTAVLPAVRLPSDGVQKAIVAVLKTRKAR